MSETTIRTEDVIFKFLTIQKENLYVVQEIKKTGKVPETHQEYIDYLDRALESLTNLGFLRIEIDEQT